MFLKKITVMISDFLSGESEILFLYCESLTPEMEQTTCMQLTALWKCIHSFTFKFKLQAVNEQCVNAWQLLITEFKS